MKIGKEITNAEYQQDIIASVLDSVEEILGDMLPQLEPTWAEDPYLLYAKEKDAWWLALTDEEEFCRYLPWKDFEEMALEDDPEVREALMLKLQDLADKLKNSLDDRT